MAREFLVTKLVCATCGSNLTVTYEKPMSPARYADGEPTGADMVEVRVAVSPCKPCLAPLESMRAAARALVAAGQA